MTQAVTLFNYPDDRVAEYCEGAVEFIRNENKKLMDSIVKVGERLIRVKTMLGHGMFCDWLGFHFGMSTSTAENYMNACVAVARFPNLWEYDPSVVYLFTRALPPAAADAIVESGPLPVDEARGIIRECKGQEWYKEVGELVKTDPGSALHRITWAMGDNHLKEHAARAMEEHAGVFAALSDRQEWEVKKEAGMDLPARLKVTPAGPPQALYLYEGEKNHRIALWESGGEPVDVLIFPKPPTAAARSWQNALLDVLLKSEDVDVRTADDLF